MAFVSLGALKAAQMIEKVLGADRCLRVPGGVTVFIDPSIEHLRLYEGPDVFSACNAIDLRVKMAGRSAMGKVKSQQLMLWPANRRPLF